MRCITRAAKSTDPTYRGQVTQTLMQRYALDEVVGTGGMGSVYRATDTRLGRTVAIKVLKAGTEDDEINRARMRSEAHLAAAIHHPGVAQVFDFEEDDSPEDGATFIVMQYIEGHSLGQLLKERGPMAPDQVMSVVQQVAEGLQAAHDAGIVHRDLKPANIMLTPEGRTVLVDFGIARTDTSEPLTDTGSLVGTTDYMSPEQVRGRLATPRSDLYALGVVAFHCLTGTSPFRRETHIGTAMAQLHDELPDLGPTVPEDVAGLVRSLTAKDAAERPATAAEVAAEAARIGAARSIDLPEDFEQPRPSREIATDPIPLPTSAVRAVAPHQRRRPRVAYASVGVIVLVAALLGGRQLMFGGPPLVPDVVGLQAADATSRIDEAGLTARTKVVDVANTPEGEVVKQSPAPGAEGSESSPVMLAVASGKVRITARSLVGKPYADVAAALERRGFAVKRQDVTRAGDTGEVVALDKTGRLPDGATILVSVAVAPVVTNVVTVPQATGGSASSGSGGAKSSGNQGKGNNNGKAKGKSKGKGKG